MIGFVVCLVGRLLYDLLYLLYLGRCFGCGLVEVLFGDCCLVLLYVVICVVG